MANSEAGSISSYLLKLVEVAERQLDFTRRSEESFRARTAAIDERFSHAADMFAQVGSWVRGQGDEIVRTNERLVTLAERMALADERMAGSAERMARADERMALTDERILATDERLERLEGQIEQLLRALLRARGDGEGA